MAPRKKKNSKAAAKKHAFLERHRQMVINNTINSFMGFIPKFTPKMKKRIKTHLIVFYLKHICLSVHNNCRHSTLGKFGRYEEQLFTGVDNGVNMDLFPELLPKPKYQKEIEPKISLNNELQKQRKREKTEDKPVKREGRPHIVFLKIADDNVNAPSKVAQASGSQFTNGEALDDISVVRVNELCELQSSSSSNVLSNDISSVRKEANSTSAISKKLSALSDFNTSCYINDLAYRNPFHKNSTNVQYQQNNAFNVVPGLHLPGDVSLLRNEFPISKVRTESVTSESVGGMFVHQPQRVPAAFGYNSKFVQNVGSENSTAAYTTIANSPVQEIPGLHRCNTVARGTSLRAMNKENVNVWNGKTKHLKRVCAPLNTERTFSNNIEISKEDCPKFREETLISNEPELQRVGKQVSRRITKNKLDHLEKTTTALTQVTSTLTRNRKSVFKENNDLSMQQVAVHSRNDENANKRQFEYSNSMGLTKKSNITVCKDSVIKPSGLLNAKGPVRNLNKDFVSVVEKKKPLSDSTNTTAQRSTVKQDVSITLRHQRLGTDGNDAVSKTKIRYRNTEPCNKLQEVKVKINTENEASTSAGAYYQTNDLSLNNRETSFDGNTREVTHPANSTIEHDRQHLQNCVSSPFKCMLGINTNCVNSQFDTKIYFADDTGSGIEYLFNLFEAQQ